MTTRRPARSGRARRRRARGRPVASAAMSAGSGSRPGPGVGAGEPADGRRQDDGAAAAQRGDVVLRRRVQPHLGVHRRHEHDRTGRGEQGGGEQVVGAAHGGAGQQVGGGRGDDDEVGVLPDAHVRDLGDVGPDVGGDRVAGQRLEGGRADEVQRAGRRDDADVVPGLGERAQHEGGLVGGHSPAHTQHDRRHGAHPPNTRTHPAASCRVRSHQSGCPRAAGGRLSSRRRCGSADPR